MFSAYVHPTYNLFQLLFCIYTVRIFVPNVRYTEYLLRMTLQILAITSINAHLSLSEQDSFLAWNCPHLDIQFSPS